MSATPGPFEHAVLEPARLLERVIGGEHRVHMAGEQQLHRRRRAHRQMQVPAMLDVRPCARPDRPLRPAPRFSSASAPGSAAKASASRSAMRLEPGEVARAAVDRGPGEHLVEHRLGASALDRSRVRWTTIPPWLAAPSRAALRNATPPRRWRSPARSRAASARRTNRRSTWSPTSASSPRRTLSWIAPLAVLRLVRFSTAPTPPDSRWPRRIADAPAMGAASTALPCTAARGARRAGGRGRNSRTAPGP